MATAEMARNDLVGIRFTAEEHQLLDRLVEHFQANNPGMRFNKQMVIRAAVFTYAKTLGVDPAPPPPPSKPRAKKR